MIEDKGEITPQLVHIIDIDIPFISMVKFMVKWAIASIPAFIIFFFIVGLIGGLISPWYHPPVINY